MNVDSSLPWLQSLGCVLNVAIGVVTENQFIGTFAWNLEVKIFGAEVQSSKKGFFTILLGETE